MAPQPPQKNEQQEAEFTRKMVLGILSTLETKGLLSQGEVESIIRAARASSQPPAAPRSTGPAAPGTRWADREGQPLGMDRTTPIAIPDVKRNRESTDEKAREPMPVIDLTME